ncbi:hypothetical protein D3C72_2073020 [compost metagenome]
MSCRAKIGSRSTVEFNVRHKTIGCSANNRKHQREAVTCGANNRFWRAANANMGVEVAGFGLRKDISVVECGPGIPTPSHWLFFDELRKEFDLLLE